MDKLQSLREQMGKAGMDGLFVSSTQNRRYLTNFTGTYGFVLLTADKAILLTDFRYMTQATEQTQGYEVLKLVTKESLFAEVARLAEQAGVKRLGFEEDHLTSAQHRKLQAEWKQELIPVSGMVEGLRMIKTTDEIAKIRTAAQIADAAFTHILQWLKPGVSEREVANELEMYMRKQGASSSAFDTIVASGVRSSLPHGVATDKKIETGEMITLDFGALYQGYRSDITRTVAIGEPSPKLKEVYGIVLSALERAIAGIKPGIIGSEADAIARDYIASHGYGECFGHGLGHAVGLDIHEEPFLSKICDKVLKADMVLTVEPGIYLPGQGGVRIEDDILVTSEGNELLTHSKRELIIL
ncbi:M24 family metallopeptidase [Brevibacillus sp. SYSU BS000544]|uniref:M24 family metallopeptidase n=1 Tax=Brevibacillus sp. SYSU BS000544 TaxID=3416443 RepID=UPI003CE4A1E0